ncbi:ATP-grasp domain-containing protein [Myxosarcina sp. GI1]|uniref:ATP-grasp domain-containing protein n=1 Tax=Myxosarcina sp. GI1 TaxID=1541065 RepID=UPI00056B3CD3|nr:ATP-grasp domain-containing protein [Myxosarcina sp. GI1]
MAQILFVSGQGTASAIVKNLGTLFLLLLLLPFNLAVVFLSLIWSIFTTPFRRRNIGTNEKKRILITGAKMTKALQLARFFHRDGHAVFLVETHKYWLSGHRFSRAVKGFYTVPVPEQDPEGYCQALLKIVKQNNIDLFIPVSSPIASYYDSLAKKTLEPYCQAIHLDPELTEILDDKYAFCSKARELGLSAPKVFRISDPQQILDFDFDSDGSRYILKSIPYDSVLRLDLTRLPFEGMEGFVRNLPISEDKPWVMQEFIRGKEYCFHATVRNGKIRLHCCSESSPFQINYQQVDNPAIYQWVEKFVSELNLTGQVCFDVIQAADGKVYPIECNPRLHSAITMFHDHPGVAKAYLTDGEPGEEPITPLPDSKPTYWTYHELWRLTGISSLSELKAWWHKVTTGTDAILDLDDPLPFLMLHNWQIPLLLLDNLRRLKGWVKIDFNIGKLVELGGD